MGFAACCSARLAVVRGRIVLPCVVPVVVWFSHNLALGPSPQIRSLVGGADPGSAEFF